MHKQYPKRIGEKDVDQQKTNQWLQIAGLKSETEGFIITAQDQAIKTNYYRNKIFKDGTDPVGRICGQLKEIINHLVTGCTELEKTGYLHGHNKAATYLHWNICKELNIDTKSKWYEHELQTVSEKNDITIMWNMSIQTDHEIKANRLDFIINNKKENKLSTH